MTAKHPNYQKSLEEACSRLHVYLTDHFDYGCKLDYLELQDLVGEVWALLYRDAEARLSDVVGRILGKPNK